MPSIRIEGLHRLRGEIKIQGSKNAVLPVMAASLLHKGTVVIRNVPGIRDVFCMMEILKVLGCDCCFQEHTLEIDTRKAAGVRIPEELAGQMRSSVMLLGPMLGRFGEARTTHPGGCLIGKRPIDLHLQALEALGAEVHIEGDQIRARATRLKGGRIRLSYPSVGATENALMAAAAAQGPVVIQGAAREPEIGTLCCFLRTMGVEVAGEGSSTLMVHRKEPFHDVLFENPGDRIVAGTYAGAVLCAGGSLWLSGAPWQQMEAVFKPLSAAGACLKRETGGLLVSMEDRPRPLQVVTGPYPEFPTDLQSVMMAVAAAADGRSRITERVFENRFSTAKELQKMGAHIIIEDTCAVIDGRRLRGAKVRALDLRGGAALAAAALACEGETRIDGYEHIRRGYEDICGDLAGAGAHIRLTEL